MVGEAFEQPGEPQDKEVIEDFLALGVVFAPRLWVSWGESRHLLLPWRPKLIFSGF